jgi:8-oxo-dGTP pyrophosphatase MutT (NUDIX family)
LTEDIFQLGIKGLIRNTDGKILLLQVNPAQLKGDKHGTYWDLPGGRVQKDQTVQETLRREVSEETGIQTITDIKELGMVLSNLRIPVAMSDHQSTGLILGVFQCSVPEDSSIVISEEHGAYGWFSPAETAELLKVKYPPHFCELVAAL